MVLKKIFRKSTGRYEYALVSKTDLKKVLFYFGTKKPSRSEFLKQERRVQYWKRFKGRKSFTFVRNHPRRTVYGNFLIKKHIRRYKK